MMAKLQTSFGIGLLVFLLFFKLSTQGQDLPSHKVIIFGNTADVGLQTPIYKNLRALLVSDLTPATVLLNGDFTEGITNISSDSLKIQSVLETVKDLDHVRLIVLPGDRDWANSGPTGWKYVRKLERLVNSFDLPNVEWAIKNGCPGPQEILLDEHILLVAVQTQWWNHPYDKPNPSDAQCKIASEADFNEELVDLIEENADKNILIAGHYPLMSYGPYGGKHPLKKYLLPLPIISGMVPSFRSNIGTSKDLSNNKFKPLRHRLQQLFEEHHGLIYLSAHERNLQLLKYNDNYQLNSGSLINPGYSGRGNLALYAESKAGYIELHFFNNGKTKALIKGTQANDTTAKSFTLYESACDAKEQGVPQNPRFIPCSRKIVASESSPSLDALVTTAAGPEYIANRFKQSWMGKHYRDSWTAAVSMPYLNLDTTYQGLTPFQKGGGRQTTSLKFRAGNGGEYVFRSVNKDPSKALDYALRGTVVGTVVKDQTSTQQPYGAMAADVLLNRLNILHAHPKLYVLPPDDRLGSFKDNFAGLVGMLEERPTNPKKVKKPFAQADQVLKSYKLFRELYDDHDNKVNTTEFARARVFDMLVGDWGKHEDNWKWAGFKEPAGVTYRPIPRDRDHVFSLWDGVLPWLADREWAKPSAANFGYEFKGVRSLMWQARHLDRFLANQLTSKDWEEAAKFIQQQIQEDDIDQAVKQMPPEIYQSDGKIIGEKLRQRLTTLDQAAVEYYRMLAKQVDVVGSNKKECFEVARNEDGSVEVTIYDLDKNTNGPDSSRMYYHRKFLPHETKEIRLYGLQKADQFHVFGNAKKSIPIRVIGGPGKDQIIDESVVAGWGKKTLVYEKDEAAILDLGTEGKQVNHWNDEVYHYNRTAFAYNTYLPQAMLLFSKDFGIGLRAGVHFTNQKFGKQDYSNKHDVKLEVTSENIKVLEYQSRYHHVFGKWDVSLEGLIADHYYFTYFFGLGNDTKKDEDLFDEDFYRTSYNSIQLKIGLIRELWESNQSYFSFKLNYENNTEQIDENTILREDTQEVVGIDDTNLWEGIIDLNLDFRDRTSLPERGMKFYLQNRTGVLTTENGKVYGVAQGYLEGYISAYFARPVTLGLRFGGSQSYGEVPFYKFKYLGQNNDLRGYLRNRFTGESTLFLNSELRWELAEFHTSFFPLKFGVKAFFDTGRVYSTYDLTDNWHQGYGAGIYVIPLKEAISLNLSVAFSEEESGLFLFRIGKAF